MTYRHPDLTLPVEFLEEIAAQGFDVLPELIRIVTPSMRAVLSSFLNSDNTNPIPERRWFRQVSVLRLTDGRQTLRSVPDERAGGFMDSRAKLASDYLLSVLADCG